MVVLSVVFLANLRNVFSENEKNHQKFVCFRDFRRF